MSGIVDVSILCCLCYCYDLDYLYFLKQATEVNESERGDYLIMEAMSRGKEEGMVIKVLS